MGLQDKLNARKHQFESEAPRETLATMHRATEDLRRSGIMDQVAKEGDRMPDFTLPDTQGQMIQGKQIWERGPMVLSFYRGAW